MARRKAAPGAGVRLQAAGMATHLAAKPSSPTPVSMPVFIGMCATIEAYLREGRDAALLALRPADAAKNA